VSKGPSPRGLLLAAALATTLLASQAAAGNGPPTVQTAAHVSAGIKRTGDTKNGHPLYELDYHVPGRSVNAIKLVIPGQQLSGEFFSECAGGGDTLVCDAPGGDGGSVRFQAAGDPKRFPRASFFWSKDRGFHYQGPFPVDGTGLDKIVFHFRPGSVPADGIGHFDGTVGVVDFRGVPQEGQGLKLSPPETAHPRALVCSRGGGRLYPTRLSSGDFVGLPFQRTTGPGGDTFFSVYVGTEPGDWFMGAQESDDPSVKDALSFPFDQVPAEPFPTTSDWLPSRFYALLKNGSATGEANAVLRIRGIVGTDIGSGRNPAAEQKLLLAFLEASGRTAFPEAAIAPIHSSGHAGILFYPRGSQSPFDAPARVLDTDEAVQLIEAEAHNEPIPAGAVTAPSVSEWSSQTGAPVDRGSLAPSPDERFLYFGNPYRPRGGDAISETRFETDCVKPDPSTFEVQVHSPLTLTLKLPDGRQVGLDSHGRPVRVAPGMVLVNSRTHTTTYIVPSANYQVSLTGTGKGKASVVFLSSSSRHEHVRVFDFSVRKGRTGQLAATGSGPASKLTFASQTVRAASGIGVRVGGLPSNLIAGHKVKLRLKVAEEFGTALAGAQVTVVNGRFKLAAATDSKGKATLVLKKASRGTLHVKVSAPGALGFKASIPVH
jgi:hypothetical protein